MENGESIRAVNYILICDPFASQRRRVIGQNAQSANQPSIILQFVRIRRMFDYYVIAEMPALCPGTKACNKLGTRTDRYNSVEPTPRPKSKSKSIFCSRTTLIASRGLNTGSFYDGIRTFQ